MDSSSVLSAASAGRSTPRRRRPPGRSRSVPHRSSRRSRMPEGGSSEQTALAALQQTRLRRTLGRADIVFFIVAAVISIDTSGLMASGGGEGVVWASFLALAFLVPYALVFSETSAAFPAEGGPYYWVKLAFGRAWGAVAVVLYWITNPIWLGGSLAFIAAEAWSQYVVTTEEGGVGDYAFKLAFVWLAIVLAIVSLRRGKVVINAGAVAKLLVLLSLCLTALCTRSATAPPVPATSRSRPPPAGSWPSCPSRCSPTWAS